MSSRREKNRRIRRLKTNLAFYSSAFSELKEALVDYENEWARDSQAAIKRFSQAEKEVSSNAESNIFNFNTQSAQETPGVDDCSAGKEEEQEKDLESHQVPKWAKDLFRKIARRTHPDVNDDPQLVKCFRSATEAMEDQKYDDLIDVALDIGIDPGLNQSQMLEKLSSRINSLKKKVEKIENSVAWLWGETYELKDARVKILATFLKSNDLDFTEEDLLEFVNSLSVS